MYHHYFNVDTAGVLLHGHKQGRSGDWGGVHGLLHLQQQLHQQPPGPALDRHNLALYQHGPAQDQHGIIALDRHGPAQIQHGIIAQDQHDIALDQLGLALDQHSPTWSQSRLKSKQTRIVW